MSKGVTIGLKSLYYALLDTDTANSPPATYEAPVSIPGAISANVNPNASNETLFADDGPYETASTIGAIELELNVADLPIETQAALLGHTLSGGVLIRKSSDTPPFVAIGFKALKSNGHYRYTWLGKGKFSIPEQANETKGDSVNFQTPTIKGSFLKRDCDDEWERHIDEDHVDYVASMGTNWFTNPYGGTPDTSAPTIASVVPADNASAVAKATTVVWTFNEALALSTIIGANFMLAKDDGTPVASTLSVNAGRTIVTLTPDSALAGVTTYKAIVTTGVKNLGGVALAAASMTDFETIA